MLLFDFISMPTHWVSKFAQNKGICDYFLPNFAGSLWHQKQEIFSDSHPHNFWNRWQVLIMRFKPETGQKILIRGLSWYPNYVLNEDSQILCPYFLGGTLVGGIPLVFVNGGCWKCSGTAMEGPTAKNAEHWPPLAGAECVRTGCQNFTWNG
jgi:hypothetical protein